MNRNLIVCSRMSVRLTVLFAAITWCTAVAAFAATDYQVDIPTEGGPTTSSKAGPSTPPPTPPPAPLPRSAGPVVPAASTIAPFDTLHAEMDGQPDISRDYVVDTNGDIQVLYVGKVNVVGLTVDQAQAVLVERLHKLYHTVNLVLTRTSLGGISVTVNGAVAHSGQTSIRRDARLNDALQPTVPSLDADLSHIVITHSGVTGDGGSQTVDLGSYLGTGRPDGNPTMHDGDTIFVPTRSRVVAQTFSVSVDGAVPHPGRFDVPPGTTAYDAVTLAGGLSPEADEKALYVESLNTPGHRLLDWTRVAISPGSIDLNPVLVDGDKIVVPQMTVAQTFSIMGAVRTPNTYPVHGSISLLDALSMAGGFDAGASAKDVKVVRGEGMHAATYPVNADDPIKAAQFTIVPNDHIIVPTEKAKKEGYHPDPLAVIGVLLTGYTIFHK